MTVSIKPSLRSASTVVVLSKGIGSLRSTSGSTFAIPARGRRNYSGSNFKTIQDKLLKVEFQRLSECWKKETISLSSVTEMVHHEAYQKIIRMGEGVVPLILNDLLQNGPDHWFWALVAITKNNPVTDGTPTNLKAVTEAWLKWGRQKGYLVISAMKSPRTSQV